MYRLLVTGGRDLPEAEIVWLPLWMMLHKKKALVVVHGAADSGADLYAHEWFALPEQAFNRPRRRYEDTVEYLALEERHPADWRRHHKVGGRIRNQEMVDAGADACFAFPTPRSRGTLDCMARAWAHDIPIYVWHHLKPGNYHMLSADAGAQLAHQLGVGR